MEETSTGIRPATASRISVHGSWAAGARKRAAPRGVSATVTAAPLRRADHRVRARDTASYQLRQPLVAALT
ncbi:hypothetical protein ABT214_33180, partial [Micromonospora purpureochromogenes]|uniref:hypothetical protein n=1 Tax=Micromonospora purpureochromogenes TaxID=47872 RepID=UPI00332D70B2